jgi:flagellar basal-body rod modification protein FlgD
MMDSINSNFEIYASLGLTSNQSQTEKKDGLKIDDFMHLMVTELTHQDPFKPMDNSELATQISQFATVSGIDQLNSSFSSLSNSIHSEQALQAANLVGHDVLVASDLAALTPGEGVQGVIDLPRSATNITLRVSDLNGALIREMELGSHEAGKLRFNWDGYDTEGDILPAGRYRISTVATVDDVEIAPQVLVSAQVNSVSIGAPGQPMALNLNGLGNVSWNEVVEIH